jgi:DNA (cytosine-5)-methyltransferase 1
VEGGEVSGLVLSLFPGIGLLDMAFEEEGFCVVRGPDLLWGGDVKQFHPSAGCFDGVIGGPPCQAFSKLRHIVEANGFKTAENLIPEFERCVREAQPAWFLMENVPDAPKPDLPKYYHAEAVLQDSWCGGETSRLRRFSFGRRELAPHGWRFQPETLALHTLNPEYAVTCDARKRPVALLSGMRPKKARESGGVSSSLNRGGGTMSIEEMARLQGVSADFLARIQEHGAFTAKALRKGIGNGVPLPMGRAVARAVKAALSEKRDAA